MQIKGSMLGHIVLVDIRLGGNEGIDRLPMLVTDHRPGGILSGHLFRNSREKRTDYFQGVLPGDHPEASPAGCWFPVSGDPIATLDPRKPAPAETPAEQAGNGAVTETGEHDDIDPNEEEREHADAHREEHGQHPWEAYGHSRSWYYKHRREGTLPPLPSQEQQDEFDEQRAEAKKRREEQG